MFRVLSGLMFIFVIGGCATSSTLESGVGEPRVYSAPLDKVILAARYSVDGLNVKVTSSGVVGAYYIISFSKGISMASWGEVGKVSVSAGRKGGVLVDVRTEKRAKHQVTGAGQDDFARLIFEGIDAGLEDLAGE